MNIDRLQASVRAKSLHPEEDNLESWQAVYIQWCWERLEEDYGTLDGLYWGALNPYAIDPEFPEVFEAMSSQVLAMFVQENAEAIDRLKDGIEQLFEGKEALGRELFLDGLKGVGTLEEFLRSEFAGAQLGVRELSLVLNRVLRELVVTMI